MGYSNDDDEADLDDREFPGPEDVGDDESIETEPCPHCGKPVFEQAEVCTHCRSFISREDSLPRRKPIWFILTVFIIVIAVVTLWVIHGLY